jgi:hypothetical protein
MNPNTSINLVMDLDLSRFPPRILVFLGNGTKEHIGIWKDNTPWGYEAPCVFLRDRATDKEYVIRRRLHDWTVTPGGYYCIPPVNTITVEYDLSDGSWVVPESVDLMTHKYQVRVELHYEESELGSEFGVFAGKITGRWQE